MTERRFLTRRSSSEKLYQQQVKVVIICEEKRTEPSYFQEYISKHFRDPKNIRIIANTTGKTGIEQLYKVACKNKLKYANAAIFIVFDNDGKTDNVTENQQLLSILSKCCLPGDVSKDKINCIFSNPQFELWPILHFEYTTAVLNKKNVEEKVKQYFPGYTPKGNKIVSYDIILKDSEAEGRAIKHAKQLRNHHLKTKRNGFIECPTTNMDVLIEYMNAVCMHRPS